MRYHKNLIQILDIHLILKACVQLSPLNHYNYYSTNILVLAEFFSSIPFSLSIFLIESSRKPQVPGNSNFVLSWKFPI